METSNIDIMANERYVEKLPAGDRYVKSCDIGDECAVSGDDRLLFAGRVYPHEAIQRGRGGRHRPPLPRSPVVMVLE